MSNPRTSVGPEGRGAVVTGAGRGLGREIAKKLALLGYVVHVTDVDGAAAAECAQAIGGRAWASALDVRDSAASFEVAEQTVQRTEGLAAWVNNAGILPTGLSWDHDAQQRRLVFDVNAHGTINGTLAALEHMRSAGHGHIVNVVSLAGLVAPAGQALYAATKHACLAFSLGTLHDVRRAGYKRIHVSALCPDGIWTPMLYAKVGDPEAALSWSGSLLQPEFVAQKAVELLERPRPVKAIPPWRGLAVRAFDAAPRLALAISPLVMADARRKQRAFKRKSERPAS